MSRWFLTVFIDLGDDFLERLFTELVAQHGQYGTHHVGTDATLFVVVESVEGLLQDCEGFKITFDESYVEVIRTIVRVTNAEEATTHEQFDPWSDRPEIITKRMYLLQHSMSRFAMGFEAMRVRD